MAAALGTCGATLRKRMRALGFRPRSSSRGALKQAVIPPTKAMLALLANVERRPTSQIGTILGVSRAMVSLYMRRFGLPTLTTQEGIARYLEWRHRVVDIEAERRRLTTLFVDATVVEALETSPHLRHED
jgi:predicted transcriptional regulator